MKKIFTFATLLFVTPMLALAQFGEIDTFFLKMMHFIGYVLVPFIISIAFLVFIWGMFTYFIQGGASPESQAKGRQMIIYSVAGFVFMVIIWGVVNLFANGLTTALGGSTAAPNLPALPGQAQSVTPTNAGTQPSAANPASMYQPSGTVPSGNASFTPPPSSNTGYGPQ